MAIKIPKCERDDFPILDIHGQWQCVGEFLHHRLGNQKMTGVIQRDGTLYYVFEDGHQLPSRCFCCGEPLACADLAAEQKHIRGRSVKDLTWDVEQVKPGREMIYLELEFSRKLLEWKTYGARLSVLSVSRMVHPEDCHFHPSTPAKKRKRS